MKVDSETEFMQGLIELQYGLDVVEKLQDVAGRVSWAVGWPKKKDAFWNAEAFMWKHKIDKEKRKFIIEELAFLSGRNLDVGCGAFSYVDGSVGFDLSSKMLDFNEECSEKIVGDLEGELPFTSGSFDSVTAVFVLNYVEDYVGLFSKVKRVLKDGGNFVMVLSSGKVNEWQRQKEVNSFCMGDWLSVLQGVGFNVNVKEKEGLWFFVCCKTKAY